MAQCGDYCSAGADRAPGRQACKREVCHVSAHVERPSQRHQKKSRHHILSARLVFQRHLYLHTELHPLLIILLR